MRSSKAAGRKEIHSNLLIEPITLPDMTHVEIDNIPNDDSRLFYVTGEKNTTVSRQVEIAFKNTKIREDEGVIPSIKITKSLQRAPKSPSFPPKPKDKLFYGKKKDKSTEDLISSMRKNEVKFKAKITSVT